MVDVYLSQAERMAVQMGNMYVYPRAEIAASSILYSKLLTGAQKSESYWVLIQYTVYTPVPRVVPTIGAI